MRTVISNTKEDYMGYLSDAELLAGYKMAGLTECVECGRLFKIVDQVCDLCPEDEEEEEEEEVELAA
jgi:hypothetical protein